MAKLNLPPLNAVRAFEAAARRGSFVEAAADLNVTHWAIGKQIRQLEDWLGVPLFERRSSGVALTDEGAELSTDVSAVLSRLSEAAGKLRRPEVTRRVSGLVRVNVQPSFNPGGYLVTDRFGGRFCNEYRYTRVQTYWYEAFHFDAERLQSLSGSK